jgi:hypothetical protein
MENCYILTTNFLDFITFHEQNDRYRDYVRNFFFVSLLIEVVKRKEINK